MVSSWISSNLLQDGCCTVTVILLSRPRVSIVLVTWLLQVSGEGKKGESKSEKEKILAQFFLRETVKAFCFLKGYLSCKGEELTRWHCCDVFWSLLKRKIGEDYFYKSWGIKHFTLWSTRHCLLKILTNPAVFPLICINSFEILSWCLVHLLIYML